MGLLFDEGLIIKRSEFTYFFLSRGSVVGNSVAFSDVESRHIVKVCRVSEGDLILATDGQGHVFRIRVTDISKMSVSGTIVDTVSYDRPRVRCDLAVPITTVQKTDWVIEKCTEIGVRAFHLFLCDRAAARTIRESRADRFNRIAVSAIKQSMRAFLPEFHSYSDLRSLTGLFQQYGMVIFGHLGGGSRGLRSVLSSTHSGSALVLAGPEAGFSDGEIELLIAAGATPVSFGKHRLRMETAALVLSAMVIESLEHGNSGA